MTTTTTTTAGNHQTVTLDEGQALNVLPDAAGTGTAYLLDNSLGLGNSSQSWALAAGVPLQLGPFSGTRRVRIVCATGAIQATALPAVLNLPQIVTSASAPSNSDGRPDGTIYIQSGAGIFVKVSGSYVSSGSGSSVVTLTGSRNIANTDNGATLVWAGSADITLTIPQGVSIPSGFSYMELGTGKIYVNPGAGVSQSNIGMTTGPGSVGSVFSVGTDSYGVQNPQTSNDVLLGSCGVVCLIANGGWTLGANGAVTFGTAVGAAWPQALIYMPAGSLTASNVAGWYYATFPTNNTQATVYNNRYDPASGVPPVFPASPTPFAAAAGTNTTQDSGSIQGPTVIIPGGAMGKNGKAKISAQFQAGGTGTTKTITLGFGSGTYAVNTLTTTQVLGEVDILVRNLGRTDRQMPRTKAGTVASTAPVFLTQDTTANIPLSFLMSPGSVSGDWIACHYADFFYSYST
ncbi:hypothetical protein FEE59_13795 [Herbaspirillum sp. RU 5E]|nr:hypothetical protein [Herbaspirillum sp. RU 5E]